MRISALKNQRIALLGLGREGKAVYEVLRKYFPSQPLYIICEQAPEWEPIDSNVIIQVENLNEVDLSAFDVLIKSPGISLYHPAIIAAKKAGVSITSGSNIWFSERGDQIVVAITGSKGKSTTAALTAHLFQTSGLKVELAGNIGVPLIEKLDVEADIWVLELSSFQIADLDANLDLAVLLSWFPEHLDWHGGVKIYQQDKLRLLGMAKQQLIANEVSPLVKKVLPMLQPLVYDQTGVWSVAEDGIARNGQLALSADMIPLPGRHNWRNACAALSIFEHFSNHFSISIEQALSAISTFKSLPHRLEVIAKVAGRIYVNDSIATTPLATVMGLRAYQGKNIILIAGGFDRGLTWTPVVEQLKIQPFQAVIGLPDTGYQLIDSLERQLENKSESKLTDIALNKILYKAEDLGHALEISQSIDAGLNEQVILLSPGAASFCQFRNFVERGECFSELVSQLINSEVITQAH